MTPVRIATDEEAAAASPRHADRRGAAYAVVRGDDVRAIGLITATGLVTDPDVPSLEIVVRPDDVDAERELGELLDALVSEARRLGLDRLMIGWSPMDAPGLRVLERTGFRNVGRMPYFELGGGQVEYVSGYRDATGSTLDLALDLGS